MLPLAGGLKCFLRVHQTLNFMLQKITNLILISKNVLIVMVPLLITKDVFEPSDNDLKFIDQNHNYFFIRAFLVAH